MFNDNIFDYSEIGNLILEGKTQCLDTSCVRDLIDFLQEQIDILEDEYYERENNLQEIYNEDE